MRSKNPPTAAIPDALPLFPTEEQIAVLVLGQTRAKEWPRIAKILEAVDHFPPIDEHVGARYWPAVAGYFHNRWNVDLYNSQARVRIAPRPLGPDKRRRETVNE